MAKSPALCHKYVAQEIAPIRLKFPQAYIIHYKDDIFLAHPSEDSLLRILTQLEASLVSLGLCVTPEKIQHSPLFSYLGYHIEGRQICPQRLQIRLDALNTLKDFQKLLGDIN